jgi:ribosomal protein L11 methyltransferase
MQNIFQQEQLIYIVEFALPYKDLLVVQEELSDLYPSMSYFEDEVNKERWIVQIYMNTHEKKEAIENLSRIIGHISLSDPIKISLLEDKDWVEEVQKNYQPIDIKQFFIRSTYFQGEVPKNKIEIIIDPGRSFGTGEHETTKGCLNAIGELEKILSPKRVLDMGTGSGILAIAARKIWDTQILAVDMDEVSIHSAGSNASLNNLEDIEFRVSNGYDNIRLKERDDFDLILCNILANPIIEMAKKMIATLSPEGFVILSGFLKNQLDDVLEAHHHLKVHKIVNYDNWITLVLRKSAFII